MGWECPECGTIAKFGDHFCWNCRTPRGAHRDHLLPERKLVTILFVDIRGSFELIHGQDPECIDEILTSAVDQMRRALHAFGGTVCRVVGDGLLALFGAPVAAEDHAVRACHAALELTREFRRARESNNANIEIRVGLSSGEVLVKTVESDTATNYDAKGEDVYLAARMEQLAEPGSVLISDHTRRLVDGYFELRALGPTVVKGLPEPVATYVLLRARNRRTRLGVAAERGLSPMVGRLREQAIVIRIRNQVLAGTPHTLVVRAEAGQGKSRLIHETVVARPGGWTLLTAQALPYGRASFRTICDLMASLLQITAADELETLSVRVATRVGARDADKFYHPIAALYGRDVGDPDWQACDAAERLRRIQDCVCSIFMAASRSSPLALVVEDGQWIDAESLLLLRELMQRSLNDPIFLVVTCRPEFEINWPPSSNRTELALAPLPEHAMRQLFRSLVQPTGGETDILETFAVQRATGNPFFLEETLAAVADDGVLARTDAGGYRLAGREFVAGHQLSPSLRSLLSARIDRLSRGQKEVLQVAAVAGQSGSNTILQRLTGLNAAALTSIVEYLQTRGFLHVAEDPDPTWRFHHALTRDAAYAGIPRSRRVTIHRALIAVLDTVDSTTGRKNLELLAHHAEQGELWAAAAGYAYEAGKAATWWRRDHEEALHLYRQAMVCIERLPDHPDKDRLALDLQLATREPLMVLGRMTAVSEALAAAEPLARALGDRPRLGLCLVFRCHAYWFSGDPESALRASDEAIALASELRDPALKARARYQSGLIWYSLGNYEQAIQCLAEPLAASGNDPTGTGYQLGSQLSVTALSYMARALADLGRWSEAIEVTTQAHRLAESQHDPWAMTVALMALGHVRISQEDPKSALDPLSVALDLSTRGTRLMWPVVANLLGTAKVHTGEVAAGLELLEQSVIEDERIGMRIQHPVRLAALAEGYLIAGRRVDALSTARRAFADALRQGEQGAAASALMLIGQAISHRRPRAGHSVLLRAYEDSRRLSMLPTANACKRAMAPFEVAQSIS